MADVNRALLPIAQEDDTSILIRQQVCKALQGLCGASQGHEVNPAKGHGETTLFSNRPPQRGGKVEGRRLVQQVQGQPGAVLTIT